MTLRSLVCFALLAGCSVGSPRPGGDPPPTDGDGGTSTPGTETCNGMDDDGDGTIDEGCACAEGASQSCWPGPASARGRGICADGAQACDAGPEFGAWGACEGAVLPGTEIEGNCIDEDCNGDAPGCIDPCAEFET